MAAFATVYEVKDSEAVIRAGNGAYTTINLPGSTELNVGDVIQIDLQSGEFYGRIAENGLERGNSIGVIKEEVDDGFLVDKNGVVRKVTDPEDYDVKKGNTVELTDADTICNVLSEDPVSSRPSPPEETDVEEIINSLRKQSDDLSVRGFEDFGGMSDQIRQVQERVELFLQERERLEEVGVETNMGAIFYGPAGTGKTHFARILAKESDATFYRIRGPEIVTKWVGDTEEIIRALFKDAAKEENEPSIVYFDEIDSLGSERGDGANQQFGNRVVAQLLTEMDGFEDSDENIMVIASTNRIEGVDDALLRSGRFDWKIPFPKPTAEERVDIFDTLREQYEVSNEVSSEQIASIADGWTGAELKGLLNEAGALCVADDRNEIKLVDILRSYERRVEQGVKE
ncbi:ATP-binding protein [Halorhabdus salina]|uniref:ATP-binding protein n=1 Tax=Halorhabdus salina TaxID=2750670 RepID=UPI0015EE45EA|nr:AAA family ATPase [Halorhabdus salina]